MQPLTTNRKSALSSFAPTLALLLLVTVGATGCDLIGGVVKFSFWVVLIVVLFAALVDCSVKNSTNCFLT
jgi:hypothetical protein